MKSNIITSFLLWKQISRQVLSPNSNINGSVDQQVFYLTNGKRQKLRNFSVRKDADQNFHQVQVVNISVSAPSAGPHLGDHWATRWKVKADTWPLPSPDKTHHPRTGCSLYPHEWASTLAIWYQDRPEQSSGRRIWFIRCQFSSIQLRSLKRHV